MHRTTPLPIALLLLCALLAGCASNDPTTDAGLATGTTEQTVLDPTDDGEVAGSSQTVAGGKADAAPGNGEIRGTVQDDAGLPVADALVSRIGSEASAITDDRGAFQFTNVSSGTHVLRVTASEVFRVHEGKVSVVADRVTLVTITLVPVDGRGPGYRPHLHDYWGDETELVLFDTALDWGKSGSYSAYGLAGEVLTSVYQPNNGNWWMSFSIPERDDGMPAIVVPGTDKVRFTITWDTAEVDVDRFILGFHPGDSKFRDQEPAGNGDEVAVDIEPEDTDNGHQGFSLWQFRIKPEARAVPMTILGPINVQVVMVKGQLPVDPPHEDFWGPNTTALVRAWDPPLTGVTLCCTNFHMHFVPDSGLLVPPGTKSLDLRFSVVLSQQGGTPLDGSWDLFAKPANLAPGVGVDQYRRLEPVSTSGNEQLYRLELDPAETDAFYQESSNWKFMARPDPDAPEGFQETQHQFRLEVIANKDPAFA